MKIRHATTLAMCVVLMLFPMATASAAPPANDDIASATLIRGLPFSTDGNTSEATSASTDPTSCGAGGHTVWYRYVATANTQLEADTTGSAFDTVLAAYRGSPGALEHIACNDQWSGNQSRIRFDASTGETIYFMVASWSTSEGGALSFNVEVPPPPNGIKMILAKDAILETVSGDVIVRGVVDCQSRVEVEVYGSVSQRVNDRVIEASFYDYFDCDGWTMWDARADPYGSRSFGSGQVVVSAAAYSPERRDDSSATMPLKRCSIVGTQGHDLIHGTGRDDRICAVAGKDTLKGMGGNDVLIGGPDNDVLRGGPGADVLNGGPGRDRCIGGGGKTEMRGCEIKR